MYMYLHCCRVFLARLEIGEDLVFLEDRYVLYM